ncbi:MAG: hypothetical protein ABIG44_12580 [Planctomycetota bacterium]
MLDGIGIAHDIELPGDWVIRRGTDPAEFLPYIAEVVRAAGHPEFAFIREERDQTIYTVRGTPRSPTEAIQLFAPFSYVEEAPTQGGTVEKFLQEMSRAIGCPIRNELSQYDLDRLVWRDNSHAYYQLGAGPSEHMISSLLEKTASSLRISFDRSQCKSVVWRLHEGTLAEQP